MRTSRGRRCSYCPACRRVRRRTAARCRTSFTPSSSARSPGTRAPCASRRSCCRRSTKRPLVISGRGARNGGASLVRLLDRLGAAYLDTGESRGLVPDAHPSVVAAMRATVMREADVVLTVGRRLDFQLAYGSPAMFGDARFVRVADIASELRDNRRGDVELFASSTSALDAIAAAAAERAPAVDRQWSRGLRVRHEERV